MTAYEAVSRRTWRSIRWGRVLLILVILSLLLFLAALAWVSLRDLAGVFLGDASELSLEAVVLTVGLLFMLFFLASLPAVLILNYKAAWQSTLEATLTEDLWLCGIEDRQLDKRLSEFRQRNSFSAFVWPAVYILLVSFVFWGTIFAPRGLTGLSMSLAPYIPEGGYHFPTIAGFIDYASQNLSAVSWAFLGAYFYGLTALLYRWAKPDLTAGFIWKINVRFAVVIVVGLLIEGVLDGTAPYIPYVAFLAGIVPDIVLRWLGERFGQLINITGSNLSLTERLFKPPELQEQIDGLSYWQVDRLSEEDIVSVTDLATKETIPSLLIRTSFDTPRLLHWVDQALLCSVLCDNDGIFKAAHIFTASDLLGLHEEFGVEGILVSLNDAKSLAGSENASRMMVPTEAMLTNVIFALSHNRPNLPYIREYWANTDTPQERMSVLRRLYTEQSSVLHPEPEVGAFEELMQGILQEEPS